MVGPFRYSLAASVLAMAACAPAGGSPRVATVPSPAATVAVTGDRPASPTVAVSAGPASSPKPAASQVPSASPEAPEEAVPIPSATPEASPMPVSVTYTDESAWVEQLKATYPTSGVAFLADVSLNRAGDSAVDKAMGFNVPAKHDPVGFLWNDGDRGVDEWYPQGVGGFERDGRQWLVVTWYAKDLKEGTQVPAEALSYRGARLSLVDVTDPAHVTYRHALLVQNAANMGAKDLFRMGAVAKSGYTQGAGFAPVPVHAGGVEVYGHWAYVVDTSLGIRVFDLDRLFKAEADAPKATCGVVDGHFKAFDYRFVLPEVASYKIKGASPYSCLSFDRSSMTLWLGQYLAPTDAARSVITGLPLGADGRIGDRATASIFPRDAGGDYAHRIQGVFRRDGRTWMSMTGQSRYEGSTARLALYEDGASEGYRWRWPHGAEDLYYDDAHDRLWCLTEFPDSVLAQRDRCVFGVTLGSYMAP